MNLIENKTKVIHKTYGEGIYRKKYKENAITISFKNVGEKNIVLSAFESGLLKMIEEKTNSRSNKVILQNHDDEVIQYDTATVQIGEKNIIEASISNGTHIFNESYTIVGEKVKAKKIHACYNLTIIGDLEVDSIQVNGSLSVLGNIKARSVNCQNSLYCEKSIIGDKVEIGKDFIADSILCRDLCCFGNIIIKSTMDIENVKAEKNIIAGEGIIGKGVFSSHNTIAIEYFEFEGKVNGKVIELDTEIQYENSEKVDALDNEKNYEYLLEKTKKLILEEIKRQANGDEKNLLEFTQDISANIQYNVCEWYKVFSRVIDISYSDNLDNFFDYLILEYAKIILPNEFIEYETVEHIFTKPLEEARKMGMELPIKLKSIDEFMICLKIILLSNKQLELERNELLDKLFQSIGIKYTTVESFF